MGPLPPIAELDALAPDAFASVLAPLFEGAPAFLARLAAERPVGTWERLFVVARRIAQALPEANRIELVDAHPRLGAPPASLSALSHTEQAYDRRPRSAIDAELERLNAAYEAQFGFRYCVFVAGRSRMALAAQLAAAVGEGRSRDSELARAVDAVIDIAQDRWRRLQVDGGDA